jgi:hypothetical protein
MTCKIYYNVDHGGRAAWTVLSRSNTEKLGSNLTRGVDVCVRLFCDLLSCV